MRETLTEAIADRELAVCRGDIRRVLAVIEQRAGEKAAGSAVGQHKVEVQRITAPLQPPELADWTRTRDRQVDQLDLVPVRAQPALGQGSEIRLLADLRALDHGVPEEADPKGPRGLCQLALDIAQTKRVDLQGRPMLCRPDPTRAGGRFETEVLIRLTRDRLDHGQDAPQRRQLDHSQPNLHHEQRQYPAQQEAADISNSRE